MIKDDIARLIEEAVGRAQGAGRLPSVPVPEVALEHPQRPEHGDYASSLPLRLARTARANPLEIAKTIVEHVEEEAAVQKIEVAPPGFINLHLSPSWLAGQIDTILQAGTEFANVPIGGGQRVQIEFVSANPTGPLHAGNGRWAAMGSALVRVLRAAGYAAEAEYYFNDAGTQVDVFARTLYARYQQLFGREIAVPDDGYAGDYMIDLAEEAREQFGDAWLRAPGEPPAEEIGPWGIERVMDWIKRDLSDLGVEFQSWYREQAVYEDGHYERVMDQLRERGLLVEREGAVWFASSQLGADKDEVLVRSTGVPTYLATDIGYHYDKFFVRKFDRVIDIWGADHQGHVRPLHLAMEAIGLDPERLSIIIGQLVALRRGNELVKASKRHGEIVTLREVYEEVGKDGCLFFFLSRSADAPIEFDVELAKRESAENPVYYVQYAHARIAGILNQARERLGDIVGGDVSLLVHPAELALIRKMLLLPELVELMARTLEPHHLPHYAQDLATSFHDFYEKCRVLPPKDGSGTGEQVDPELSKARLKLVAATKTVLASALDLMGMSAPERM